MTIQQRTGQVPAPGQPADAGGGGCGAPVRQHGRLGVHVAEAGSGPPLLLLQGSHRFPLLPGRVLLRLLTLGGSASARFRLGLTGCNCNRSILLRA